MSAPARRLHTEFIPGSAGALHLTSFLPEEPSRGAPVVVVQPLAEEAAKARRMVALAGRALAAAGCPVLVADLHGCGDSAGDFADAGWARWLADLHAVAALATERHGGPCRLLGIRAGALLARDAMADGLEAGSLVFWQPAPSGEALLTQFLRLRVAGDMGSPGRESVKDLRARLAAGESLEVAGYAISSGLSEPLAASRLAPPGPGGHAHWFCIARSAEAGVPPALQSRAEEWRAAGWTVGVEGVAGDAFWSTQEIVEVPALATRTAAAFTDENEAGK